MMTQKKNHIISSLELIEALTAGGKGQKHLRQQVREALKTGYDLSDFEFQPPAEKSPARKQLKQKVVAAGYDTTKVYGCNSCFNNAIARGLTEDAALKEAVKPIDEFGRTPKGKPASNCKPCTSLIVTLSKSKSISPDVAKAKLERLRAQAQMWEQLAAKAEASGKTDEKPEPEKKATHKPAERKKASAKARLVKGKKSHSAHA